MIKYQNTSQNLVRSTFTEIGTYSGNELTFDSKRPSVKVGNQEVNFAKGAITLRAPLSVKDCVNNCVVGTVIESVSINFNVVTIEALDVLKAEIDRVFALTKVSLHHGVLPPVYSDFASE